MREVEAKPIGSDQGAGLVYLLAEHLTECRVQEMCRRVIPLCVPPPIARYPRRRASEMKVARELADRRRTSLEFPDVFHFDAPALADDLALIGDLSTRFCVEGRLAQ